MEEFFFREKILRIATESSSYRAQLNPVLHELLINTCDNSDKESEREQEQGRTQVDHHLSSPLHGDHEIWAPDLST